MHTYHVQFNHKSLRKCMLRTNEAYFLSSINELFVLFFFFFQLFHMQKRNYFEHDAVSWVLMFGNSLGRPIFSKLRIHSPVEKFICKNFFEDRSKYYHSIIHFSQGHGTPHCQRIQFQISYTQSINLPMHDIHP